MRLLVLRIDSQQVVAPAAETGKWQEYPDGSVCMKSLRRERHGVHSALPACRLSTPSSARHLNVTRFSHGQACSQLFLPWSLMFF